MATLKDIKLKISAVRKTRQITRAMNMVAAAKLRTTQGKMENFAPYAQKFEQVLKNLASRMDASAHPLLVIKDQLSKTELLLFTGDRGLCGSFNVNAIAEAESWLKEQAENGVESSLLTVGKKGRDYFRKRDVEITESHVSVYGAVDMAFVNQIGLDLIDRYLADEVDEVYMLYSRFVSMARQESTLVRLIPIEPPQAEQDMQGMAEYLCEPDAVELLSQLLPKHISVQIYNAFLQQETSEHAARMTAMDNATKNCSDLVESLTQIYNKARQAAITAELMDIVGGVEALK
jgi:F-type H+-transporting ATPase subunit gamma